MKNYCNRFKSTTNWNKYQSKIAIHKAPDLYLDYLIDPSFQGINRLSVSPFNPTDSRIGYSRYYLSTSKVNDNTVMIDGKNFFDRS